VSRPAGEERIVHSNIDPLIENLTRKSEHLREEAAFELRHAGGPRVVEALVGALADPVAKVRAVALDTLSRMSFDHREAIAAAALPLLSDPDDAVKLQAAKTVGRMGSGAAIDQLVALLSHALPECRLYAALALGRTGDVRAVAPLAGLLQEEKDKRVRATLLVSLGLTGNPKVVPLLLKVGLVDEDRRVRASAIEGSAASSSPTRRGSRSSTSCAGGASRRTTTASRRTP
jgi:HEAT repeat protein